MDERKTDNTSKTWSQLWEKERGYPKTQTNAESDQIDLNILRQIADETCTVSFNAWQRVRAKGYVESDIQNTPDGVYGKLSERGTKLLHQAKAPDEVVMLSHNLEHVSTQWVQLHQAISEALGLEFEPNEDIARYTEAVANLRLERDTLWSFTQEVALNKYGDPPFMATQLSRLMLMAYRLIHQFPTQPQLPTR